MREPREFVEHAKRRGDWAWVFFQMMTLADRRAFDMWLVEQGHPLAFEPGTTERRFREIVGRTS